MPARLDGWNYDTPGGYFLTICTHGRRPLLGSMDGEVCRASPLGMLAAATLQELPARYQGVLLDAWVIMPDHTHIVVHVGEGPARPSIPGVVSAWKAGVTRQARERALFPTGHALWQRGFYDRIIRNDAELDALRAYIATNPLRCALRPPPPP